MSARVWKARVSQREGGHRRVTVFSARHPDQTYANCGALTVEDGEEAANLADLLSRIMPIEHDDATSGAR